MMHSEWEVEELRLVELQVDPQRLDRAVLVRRPARKGWAASV